MSPNTGSDSSESYFGILLVSLQAYVDRAAAEVADLATPPARCAEIRENLRPLYAVLCDVLARNKQG
jgi:hypothetical protein